MTREEALIAIAGILEQVEPEARSAWVQVDVLATAVAFMVIEAKTMDTEQAISEFEKNTRMIIRDLLAGGRPFQYWIEPGGKVTPRGRG